MSFLDDSPPDYTKPEWREFLSLLSNRIYFRDQIVQLAIEAGVRPGNLALDGSARNVWFSVLRSADNEQKMPALTAVIRADSPVIAERLDRDFLGASVVVEAPSPEKPLLVGFGGTERQIVADDDTLLDIAFLETGLERAKAVCRITATFGGERFFGTGFRVSETQILTNHHVLCDWDADDAVASHVVAWFDYELDQDGQPKPFDEITCDPASIVGNKTHDWALITVAEAVPTVYAPLDLVRPDLTAAVDDRVYIIQHPQGTRKKIGMHHNLVRHVDDDVLQYWTDTAAGSSGSPVFNRRWELVGLHHYWTLTDGDEHAFANQGRRIEQVIASMSAQGCEV